MLKKFLLNALSSFVGAWLAIVLVVTACVLAAIGIAGSFALKDSNSAPSLKKRSVLVLDLSGPIDERESNLEPDWQAIMKGDLKRPQTLDVITEALKEAADNDNIAALYLKCGDLSAGAATMQAIREAVSEFKKSGKKIIAYGDNYNFGTYYIATLSDKIILNPAGALDIHGLVGRNLYYKDLCDKLGVEFQVVKVGTYKSAVEPFLFNDMSEPARAQMDTLLGSMWKFMRDGVAVARPALAPEWMDSVVNTQFLQLAEASTVLKKGFVDSLLYERNVDAYIADIVGVDKKKLNFVEPSTMVTQTPWSLDYGDNNQIAVLYAVGEISDGNDNAINYEVLVPEITALADNDKVKGMVLRVNSPGGSVFGSDQIGEALDYFQSKGKPLAVSMGDYAASGGYWISARADRIFADPLTITGSIGIFGLLPNFAGTMQKIGVNEATVATNPQAYLPIPFKPLDDRQLEAMQSNVERGYDRFVNRVAKGRKMTPDQVKAIAEGRVWSAIKAKEIGLVDQLGNLGQAIEWVAVKAKVKDDYSVAAYPSYEPKIWDLISLNGITMGELAKASEMKDFEAMKIYLWRRLTGQQPLQARMPQFTVGF